MKVEIQIEDRQDPLAIIKTSEVTEDIVELMELIQHTDAPIIATHEEKLILLNAKDLYLIRTESQIVTLYTKNKSYTTSKKLYEMEQLLGPQFMRISKSSIVNLKQIKHVEPSFSGTMVMMLKNGQQDSISRTYLPAFKKYLGL